MTKKKEVKKIKTTTNIVRIETKAPAPLNQKQLLFILQKTPANHIYTRPGKGGGKFNYVTGAYVKKVLNYCFGWRWDFEIKDKGKEGNQVWVQGRLTIKDKNNNAIIVKEQFGRADVKILKSTGEPLDYGNDLKAASTDALKKCASELGIASDVYAGNEFKDIQKKDKAFIPPAEGVVEGEVVKETKEPDVKNKVEELNRMLKGNTDIKKRADLVKRTGIMLKANLSGITNKHAGVLIAALLSKEVK